MLRLIGVWFGLGLLGIFFAYPISYVLSILMFQLVTAYLLIGLLLLIVSAWHAWRRRRWSRPLIANLGAVASLALIVGVAGSHLAEAGDSLVFQTRFAYLQPRYEAVVAGLEESSSRPQSGQHGSVRYIAEPGPPLRVAFPRSGGLLDNWEGVVYDPSGAVESATGWEVQSGTYTFSAPAETRSLFGGDIVRCESIRHPHYRCWFT